MSARFVTSSCLSCNHKDQLVLMGPKCHFKEHLYHFSTSEHYELSFRSKPFCMFSNACLYTLSFCHVGDFNFNKNLVKLIEDRWYQIDLL